MESVYNEATKNKKQKKEQRSALQVFHNDVKKILITKFAFKSEQHLDLCCGRGGDISKFMYSEIEQIILIDISSISVKEARQRYENYYKFLAKKTIFSFETFDLRKERKINISSSVSCMFALHYFFESLQIANQFLKNISNSLSKDGIFFGCVPDGKEILKLLKNEKKFKNTIATIEAKFTTKECFGSEITFQLQNSILEEIKSKEYLVFENVLLKIASKVGLVGLFDYDLDGLVEKNNKLFKHFIPPKHLTKDEQEISSINCIFAFRKI